LPLIDNLTAAGYRPGSVWADRGYCSNPLRDQIEQRGMTAQISRRRRHGDPLPQNQQTRHPKAHSRKHHIRTRDPNARHRWVVERTNAWLRRFKRLTIRNEPNSQVYLAYLTLALTIILARAL
jgi:IS5 family transposase